MRGKKNLAHFCLEQHLFSPFCLYLPLDVVSSQSVCAEGRKKANVLCDKLLCFRAKAIYFN